MKDHLIKDIEIKNFKCFDDFEAKGFARVNLIGGKNNVGKTALMEACFVNSSSVDVKILVGTLCAIKIMRENLNLLSNVDLFKGKENKLSLAKKYLEQSNGIFVKTNNTNIINFYIEENGGIKKYCFQYDKNTLLTVNVNDFSFEVGRSNNVNFIDSFGLSNKEIKNNFSFVQKRDDEVYLNKILNKFDSNITAFKVFDGSPQCKVNGMYLQITDFGDGVRHLVSIVTSFYASENGHLFIDEIDNGIHYTAIDSIWEIILKLSKELNVQVFATTHSKECIESYARVAKKLKEKDITYTILSKLKDGSIDAGVYDSEMLMNTLEQDHEVRGW